MAMVVLYHFWAPTNGY